MIRKSIIETVQSGLIVGCNLKLGYKDWFGDCKLSRFEGSYCISGCAIGSEKFKDIDAAVDFFGTLAFNERNLAHFIHYLSDLEEQGKFKMDDIEYMKDEDIEAMNSEFMVRHFKQYSPHAEKFQCKKAIRMMELLKKEAEEQEREDNEK